MIYDDPIRLVAWDFRNTFTERNRDHDLLGLVGCRHELAVLYWLTIRQPAPSEQEQEANDRW